MEIRGILYNEYYKLELTIGQLYGLEKSTTKNLSVYGGVVMSDFSRMIEEAKRDIVILMDNPKNIPWYMSSSQLEMTIKELEKMNEVRDKNMFFPYYPKGIADCWDSSDELGKKLLEILDAYKKL